MGGSSPGGKERKGKAVGVALGGEKEVLGFFQGRLLLVEESLCGDVVEWVGCL